MDELTEQSPTELYPTIAGQAPRNLPEEIDFSTTISVVAKATNLTFVAESYPRELKIDVDDKSRKAIDELLHTAVSVERRDENIKRLASMFDYDCEVRGKTVLFRKRFTKPEDLPDVTYKEAEQYLQNVAKLSRNYRFSPSNDSGSQKNISMFADSFSLNRTSPSVDGTNKTINVREGGTNVSALSATQRNLLWRATTIDKIGRFLFAGEETRDLFRRVDRKNTKVGWFVQYDERLFGVILPTDRLGFPVSAETPIMSGGGYFIKSNAIKTDAERNFAVDAKESKSTTNEATRHSPATLALGSQRIHDYVRSINTNGVKYIVDDALSNKVITIVGDQKNFATIIQAIVELYALDLKKQKDGIYKISCKQVKVARSPIELKKGLEECLPSSLFRYLKSQATREVEKRANENPTRKGKDLLLASRVFGKAVRDMRVAAVQKFDDTATSMGAKSEPLLFAELDEQGKDALGLVLLASCLPNMSEVWLNMTSVVTNFDNGVVHFDTIVENGVRKKIVLLSAPESESGRYSSFGWYIPLTEPTP